MVDILSASRPAREEARRQLADYWDSSEDYPLVEKMDVMLRTAGFSSPVWRQTAPCQWAVSAWKST